MTPRTTEQLEVIRDESRERLLKSALSLFARHGYSHTSIRMIAREAGVSQGLMYNYFESKEQLLHAIFERSTRDVQESFERARTGATPHEQLENLIRASLRIVVRDRQFWRLYYGLRFQPGVSADLDSVVAEWSASIRRGLEQLLRALGMPKPDVEAWVLFALIDGVAQHYLLDPEHYPLEETISAVLARYQRKAERP